jgi:hypothetical protein
MKKFKCLAPYRDVYLSDEVDADNKERDAAHDEVVDSWKSAQARIKELEQDKAELVKMLSRGIRVQYYSSNSELQDWMDDAEELLDRSE